MLLSVLAGFLVALAAPWIARVGGRWTGALLAVAPAAMFSWFAMQIPAVLAIGPESPAPSETYPWAPGLGMGVNLSFFLDGLAVLFALLITGIGTLIVLYAGAYMDSHPYRGRFFAWLLTFMASMLGLVIADDIITLFIFWELTSISSYFLIGFDHHREIARKNALQALLVTGGGGLALLAGLILMAVVGGSMDLSTLLTQGDVLREHALYVPILLLILLGAFTKSAQWPFHFWLPNAMEAPTPVSAYLHSSTMVKAGVYLLARLSPPLGGTELWMILLTVFGGITMVLGAYLAVRQTYLKRILAYSTVSAIGVLVFLLGVGAAGAASPEADPDLARYAAQAFAVFLLAHALYKAALFLVAGSITHETGLADVTKLGGLRSAMPITAMAAVLAALSMAGFPPFFGFISKELLFEATMKEEPAWGMALTAAAMIAGILFVIVSCLVALRPFFGAPKETPKHPHEAPLPMWLGPALLAGFGLALGAFPGYLGVPLVAPTVTSVMGATEPVDIKLVLWPGFNIALVLGAIVIIVGVLLFMMHERISRVVAPVDALNRFGPEKWYERGLDGVLGFASFQTRVLQSGYLRTYLFIVIVTTIVLGGIAILRLDTLPINIEMPEIPLWQWGYENLYALLVAGLVLAGAAGAVHSQHRLSAIASLGIVGYGVALIYVIYGAPDLAITQFIIETLTVILFVFVIYHLPRFPRISRTPQRLRDLSIATIAGGMMTVLVLLATSVQLHPPISDVHAAEAYEIGRGRNIVNVILVDFRSLDTLGEIVVLAIAAIGVLALLKLRPHGRKAGQRPTAEDTRMETVK